MKIEIRSHGGVPVLAPTGRVTIGGSALALKAALDEAIDAGAAHIILDGAKVEYLDSTGIGELIAAARRLSESYRGRVGIARPSSKLLEMLDITGLNALFLVGDDEDEVLAAIAKADPVAF
jgi:anti-sigma B factor antagonist